MKVKILLAFIFGVAVATLYTHATLEPEVQTKVEVQTRYETKEVKVKAPPTVECTAYLNAVLKLRDGQRKLSNVSGRMTQVLSDIQVNVYTKDPFKVKELQGELNRLNNDLSNAWNTIGDATATLDQYTPGQDPCR